MTELAAQRFRAGDFVEAAKLSSAALKMDARYAPALHVHGTIAYRLGRQPLACALFESAIALDGSRPLFYLDLIEAYRMHWQLDDALQVCQRATELWPEDIAVQYALSFVLYDRGETEDATAQLREVIAREPDHAQAHMRLGQILLARGDSKSGWSEYEWRSRVPQPPVMPPTSQPKWDGTNAFGGTLLLICAEGFGDTIQFARYIPLVAKHCSKLVIGCSPEMRPFIIQQDGATETFQEWADMPAYDVHCVLTSVPAILNTDITMPPAAIPYIRADVERTNLWRGRLNTAIPTDLFRVGLVWAGRPSHPNDCRRSMDFGHLIALTAVPGVALVGLQKGTSTQMPEFKGPAPFLDCATQLEDFVDTAAIVENLDLVISVDTATAHLAAAMGKPVWLLLPYTADWRWLLGRDDTPWYPKMLLFRQSQPGNWSGVINQVSHRLRNITNK